MLILRKPEKVRKMRHIAAIQEEIYNDKSLIYLPRQVSWIGKQPFAKWGNIGHNKADELNDTTDLTTKVGRVGCLRKGSEL